ALGVVWSLADITMSLMAICNLCAIVPLGRYALRCLDDYRSQKRQGADPQYHRSVNKDISADTPCWPE
ncbi:MAG: alanine:cation symporter family protein, partial [Muribaculaceae bacterium]|nr:alanine:cation symporter family protein [Muribaculaceae bacterium]